MALIDFSDQLVQVPLYYKEIEKDGFTKIIILKDEEALEMLEDEEEKKDVQVLNTWWKILSWQDSNNIANAARSKDANALPGQLDPYRTRDLRLKLCLKKWDLKDANNKDLPVTPDIINKLPPEVIGTLLEKFDKVTDMSAEEVGNS